jgi:hypothetical protein
VGPAPDRWVSAAPAGRCRAPVFALDVQAVEGEGWAGAVTDEPLAAGAVGAVDAHSGVEAECACALPGEHLVYGVLIE